MENISAIWDSVTAWFAQLPTPPMMDGEARSGVASAAPQQSAPAPVVNTQPSVNMHDHRGQSSGASVLSQDDALRARGGLAQDSASGQNSGDVHGTGMSSNHVVSQGIAGADQQPVDLHGGARPRTGGSSWDAYIQPSHKEPTSRVRRGFDDSIVYGDLQQDLFAQPRFGETLEGQRYGRDETAAARQAPSEFTNNAVPRQGSYGLFDNFDMSRTRRRSSVGYKCDELDSDLYNDFGTWQGGRELRELSSPQSRGKCDSSSQTVPRGHRGRHFKKSSTPNSKSSPDVFFSDVSSVSEDEAGVIGEYDSPRSSRPRKPGVDTTRKQSDSMYTFPPTPPSSFADSGYFGDSSSLSGGGRSFQDSGVVERRKGTSHVRRSGFDGVCQLERIPQANECAGSRLVQQQQQVRV